MAKKKSTNKKAKAKPAKKKVAKKASKKPVASPVKKKSTTVNAYLNFNGNCEAAFNFYKSVFGGKFTFVGKFKDMPPNSGGKPVSPEEGERIMHIALPISEETVLMGSDTSEQMGPPFMAGNNFSLSINTPSKATADKLFAGLSQGGQVIMPMSNTFWGSYFGMLVDKFGIQWMISFELNQK